MLSILSIEMNSYLVTGGYGFIGTELCLELLSLGHQVYVLDFPSKRCKELEKTICLDPETLEQTQLLETLKQCKGCFHLGAIASVQKSVEAPYETHRVNVGLTLQIIESLAQHSIPLPIVFASSAAVYGSLENFPLKESMTVAPKSPYAIDKYSCELYLKSAFDLYQIPSIAFRLFNVYGTRQDPNSPYSGVISRFFDYFINKHPLEIFGEGKQQRDFIFVKDVIDALILGMKTLLDQRISCDVFNLCTQTPASLLDILHHLETYFGHKAVFELRSPRQGDIFYSCGSFEKIHHALGWHPVFTIQEGLKKMVEEK